jgi:GPH family glycoside/pentoside/hexuronide:cation symporter
VTLAPWALFAALIAAAGLPIYIHAPKFYVDSYGVGLGALGGALFALRLLDVVQDPLLGWLAEAGRRWRGAMVAVAAAIMALAMLGLFAVSPPFAPLIWFSLMLALLFSAFSFLTIAFYAEGVAKAEALGPRGHLRLAGWREAGSLLGISVAAVAPVGLAALTGRPFAAFAAGFAAVALVAVWAMRREWTGAGGAAPGLGLRSALADPVTRRLLLLAVVNAGPVAVTSTLFLFFVESRLRAPGAEGPLLLLFFLAAAFTAPLWGRLAARFGAKPVLLAGMALAVLAFLFATRLGAGDVLAFAVISTASGAALGADMTLLPAIFARHLAVTGSEAGTGFGLWSFASKLSLALAAAVLLPLLEARGFTAGADNPEPALALLTLLYAALPCGLKVVAIGLLITTPVPEA